MAEFEKITKDWCKMCEEVDCLNCRIHIASYHSNQTCRLWVLRHPKEAERIITQWSAEHLESAEHPVITNGKKFEEMFGFTPYMKFRSYKDMKQWIESEWRPNKEYEK